MDGLFRLIAYRPRTVLAGLAVLTLLLASQMYDVRAREPRLRIETAVNDILPEGDEGRRVYDRFRQHFGNDEMFLVALVAENVFTMENLRRIETMTRRFSQVEGIRRVVSMSNTPDVRSVGGEILVEFLFDEVPEDEAQLQALRRRVLENPVFVGNLVSQDARAAAFVIYPREMSEKEFRDRGIDQEVERIAREEAGDAVTVIRAYPKTPAA